MKYRISVCDDNAAEAAGIKAMVDTWARENSHTAEIDVFSSAEQFLFQYAEQKNYDILLLDIEMNGISGVELAKRIRRENRTVQIIFITGYSDYILDGYEVEALHYLMKPVSPEKLSQVLGRAVEKLWRSEKALLLETKDGMVRVPMHTIRWVEVRQNYVTVHGDSDVTVKRTLSELEQELDEQFFRTGRSCIVNLQEISRITKTDVILKDGTAVPLSRGYYEKLNRAMINYF